MYILTFVFQSAFDLIPEAEEVHSNIDTAVSALVFSSLHNLPYKSFFFNSFLPRISPIFDRENELAASAA